MTAESRFVGHDQYSLLGATGLRVSPFCLGAMTFGNTERWGAAPDESRRILDCYLDHGGNFVDTANVYMNGESERLLGEFLSGTGKRNGIVLATKFAITTSPGDPNASGNGRKNIHRSLEDSLRRLKTDYVDLYWMHYWDVLTPVEEVVDTLDNLVCAGKVRYFGLSDVPAWYVARAHTYAECRGKTRIAALQLEYSLIDRSVEIEHTDAARTMGIGLCAWGPLGSGLLTGKYRNRAEGKVAAGGRISMESHYQRHLTPRNLAIVEALVGVAEKLGRPPSQVALNWISRRPVMCSTIIGARTQTQLEENLGALEFEIPSELSRELEEISRVDKPHLYNFFADPFGAHLRAANVMARPLWDR